MHQSLQLWICSYHGEDEEHGYEEVGNSRDVHPGTDSKGHGGGGDGGQRQSQQVDEELAGLNLETWRGRGVKGWCVACNGMLHKALHVGMLHA